MDLSTSPPTSSHLSARDTSPHTKSKKRFWNKFRSIPKPLPRTRFTSDSDLVEPKCPPKRIPLTPPSRPNRHLHPMIPHIALEKEKPVMYEFSTEEMTLPEFARNYHHTLPQQVMVTHGVYCRENLEVDISSSERLNIHFIRHRESVKIRELDSDVEYSVPVTSSLEFGPIYNPYQRNIRDALRGFIYPTVADMLKVIENAPLPKLVSAMTDSSITTPGDRVTKGELLLIKEVRSSTKFGYRQVKVQSLLTKTDKFLHEACQGNFTTRPEYTKLSLFNIIKYMPDGLPLSVKIFPGDNLDLGDQHYPTHLFEKVVQLCYTFTDVLLVASSVPEESVCDGREPFEIPEEVELELKVLKLKESDYEQLRDRSAQIMRRIQGDYIKQYHNAHQNQADYIIQDMFLKAVTATEETDEPHPHDPTDEPHPHDPTDEPHPHDPADEPHPHDPANEPHIHDPVEPHTHDPTNDPHTHDPTNEPHTHDPSDEPHTHNPTDELHTHNPTDEPHPHDPTDEPHSHDHNDPNINPVQGSLLSRLGKLENMVRKMSKPQALVTSETTGDDQESQPSDHVNGQPEQHSEGLHTELTELKTQLKLQQKEFHEELQCMQAAMVALQNELAEGRKEQGQLQNPIHPHPQAVSSHQQELLATPETAERNRQIVATLTSAQVLQLMVEVGVEDLHQITQENISGDILVELNENELQSELGINKRIHRLKLMKVINGSKPITHYLKEHGEPNSMDSLC